MKHRPLSFLKIRIMASMPSAEDILVKAGGHPLDVFDCQIVPHATEFPGK